jgi:hypothetical protein
MLAREEPTINLSPIDPKQRDANASPAGAAELQQIQLLCAVREST